MTNIFTELDILEDKIRRSWDSNETTILHTRKLKVHPNDSDSYFQLAEQLLKKGQLQKAKKKFQRSLQHCPGYHNLYDDWLLLLYSEREFKEATLFAKEHFKGFIFRADSHNTTGLAYLHLGDYDNAIRSFHDVMYWKYSHSMAYLNWALVLYLQEEKQEAVDVFECACHYGELQMVVYEREVSLLKEDLEREENKGLEDFIKKKIEGFEYFIHLERKRREMKM